ncbi:DUF3775 domain-containing protein [Aquibium sp. LZ166]|uniref:DUF3775 domain-containing protein n=1 Tax=Aquibium pacificus TaxID=3153579 RepID=A0ABV3SGC4_9HYPH
MTILSRQTTQEESELGIPLSKVCYIIIKAREFDAKDVQTDPDPGSNPSDDRDISVLEEHEDDPAEEELRSLIDALSVDEQVDLVALAWLGREEYPDDWTEVRAIAAEEHNERTAAYLCGNPLLADHLADGLSALDLNCGDFEAAHL